MMKTKTKIINFFGGPGVGKSTTATGLFSWMKQQGYSVEYVSEFAKELSWEGSTSQLENQAHVFAEQFRRQWRLIDQVDYVITDSPLLLSSVYFDYYFERSKQRLFSDKYKELAIRYFDSTYYEFNNLEVIIRRNKEYDSNGRNQTIEESLKIDDIITQKIKLPDLITNSKDAISDTINLIRRT